MVVNHIGLIVLGCVSSLYFGLLAAASPRRAARGGVPTRASPGPIPDIRRRAGPREHVGVRDDRRPACRCRRDDLARDPDLRTTAHRVCGHSAEASGSHPDRRA
jgi:hypothetical protein